VQRSRSSEQRINVTPSGSSRVHGHQLTPIPGSEVSAPPSPSSHKSGNLTPIITNGSYHSPAPSKDKESLKGKQRQSGSSSNTDSISRARAKSSTYVSHRPQYPQSLNAAMELLTSHSDSGHGSSPRSPTSPSSIATGSSSQHGNGNLTVNVQPSTPTKGKKQSVPLSPRRPIPATPNGGNFWAGRSTSTPTVGGKGISGPIPNHGRWLRRDMTKQLYLHPLSSQAATLQMSPVKNRATGKPIPVEPRIQTMNRVPTSILSSGYDPYPPSSDSPNPKLKTDLIQYCQKLLPQIFSNSPNLILLGSTFLPTGQVSSLGAEFQSNR
jgi:hypothetical protein